MIEASDEVLRACYLNVPLGCSRTMENSSVYQHPMRPPSIVNVPIEVSGQAFPRSGIWRPVTRVTAAPAGAANATTINVTAAIASSAIEDFLTCTTSHRLSQGHRLDPFGRFHV